MDIKKGGLANCRDLGGIVVADNKIIKPERFFRSGNLSKLNKKEVNLLKNKGIKTIIDLRIDLERSKSPDVCIEGVNNITIPILCNTLPGITNDRSMYKVFREEALLLKTHYKNADEYMKALYELILFAEDSILNLKNFVNIVLNQNQPILWHCAAGKDRAGLCAMIIEALLGASDQEIISDYIKSQKSNVLKRNFQKFGLSVYAIFTLKFKFRNILCAMLDAKEQYITHVINVLNEKYGSVLNYCKTCLGVTDQMIENFRLENTI